MLVRPRLVGALLGRWKHRVTVLGGGAGLGKTTLLAQARAENRLVPRGEDLWIGLESRHRESDALARTVAESLMRVVGEGAGRTVARLGPDPVAVADGMWRCSPAEVCLLLDDVHLLEPGSPGAAWLDALVEALPRNGHLVLATRDPEPPVRLAGLEAQGQVLRLGGDDLCFTLDELARFADARGCDAADLAATGGWPAMAELTATAGRNLAGAFLWQEVLDPLGVEDRRALTVVCDLGGGDDALVSAALDVPVDLASVLRRVPLMTRRADGWWVPHALWHTAPSVGLDASQQIEVHRRAIGHLSTRGRFEGAFELVRRARLWELAPGVLRAACLASDRHGARQLGSWLAACPESVRATAAGCLAVAIDRAFASPTEAVEPLRTAVAACRAADDADGELCAIAHLGRLGWFLQDRSIVGQGLALRVAELAATGHVRARALVAFGRATIADLQGDDQAVLSELESIENGILGPGWDAMAIWLQGMVRLDRGDAEAVCRMIERVDTTGDPGLRLVFEGLRLRAWWTMGRADDVLAAAPAAIAAVRSAGSAAIRHQVLTNSSILYSNTGNVTEARRLLDEGTVAAPARSQHGQLVRTALAAASLQLAEGHEDRAADTLRQAIAVHGLDRGIDRRGWRLTLPLTYVLVPETRAHWDQLELGGYLDTSRRLAAAVVAGRADAHQVLQHLEVPPLNVLRCALPVRLAGELAVGLAAVGRPEAAELLEALGPPGRDAVRAMTTGSAGARSARALLGTLPAAPPATSYLTAFGPVGLRRDGPIASAGQEDPGPDLRRRRVQELLAFLVLHRRTTRAAIKAALWPDVGETIGRNNLAVTLSHLQRVLEPWRRPREAPYLVRADGQNIRLMTGDHLHIDIDALDAHLAAARRAETDGLPSLALDHHLAAVALYRGELFAEISDADWITLDREHYRTRFVASATRAAQLLTGRGDTHQAENLARKALKVDCWAEETHAALAAAALARGDRSAAHRNLQRCLDVLAELGIEPSATTRQLEHRIHHHDHTPPSDPAISGGYC
jgi:DNA-binding SARP family transcriptional activator